MALQLDRASAVHIHLRMTDILGGTADRYIVLQHYAVVDNRNGGRHAILAVLVEYGSVVDDVINVPLAGLAHSVCLGG